MNSCCDEMSTEPNEAGRSHNAPYMFYLFSNNFWIVESDPARDVAS